MVPKPWQDGIVWHDWIALGYAEYAHLIHLESRRIVSFSCPMYFKNFHPLPDRLLIVSGVDIQALDTTGTQLWQSPALGVDGVILDSIEGNEIRGHGEWDPPGGWRPFAISLNTGSLMDPG